jgi:hypothetical protein
MSRWFRLWPLLLLSVLTTVALACDDDDDDNNDDTDDDDNDDDDNDDNDDDDNDNNDDNDDNDTYESNHLIPGPDEPGYDPDLEAFATRWERSFHVFTALGTGLNTDVSVPEANEEHRALIEDFLQATDEWDFAAWSGLPVFDVIDKYHAVAGLYAGVGIAADAYRYGVLRDQGYSEAEVDRAREFLVRALEEMHVATAITGVPGVIARGFMRLDIPGDAAGIELTPLFDEDGNPLPPEKTNGTWRADNSPGDQYPNYIWVDSCSRDMFIGWMAALAGAWEVIRDDPTFDEDLKDTMREDARQLGLSLMVVRESGFDLEIFDADGRTTYHGYMNENNFDRLYLPWLPFDNGMYANMALGSLAALVYVSDDDTLRSYLDDELLGERHLDRIARHNQAGVNLWVWSNYSSYNMAFMGGWLAARYLEDDAARENIKLAIAERMYDNPWQGLRQPRENKQSFFDFTYAACVAGATAWTPMSEPPDATAVANGLETLHDFAEPPHWDFPVVNCDETEIEAGHCLCVDGETEIDLHPLLGRGDKIVAVQTVPMHVRPGSNYYWRSNPYEVNSEGNGGANWLPGVDFRWAYWLGRWTR